MIEAIKTRIKCCEKRISTHKDSKNMLSRGILIGLQSELDTLNDLLKVAYKSKELEEIA